MAFHMFADNLPGRPGAAAKEIIARAEQNIDKRNIEK